MKPFKVVLRFNVTLVVGFGCWFLLLHMIDSKTKGFKLTQAILVMTTQLKNNNNTTCIDRIVGQTGFNATFF